MKVIKINNIRNYQIIRAGNFVLREEWEKFYKDKKEKDIIEVFKDWIIQGMGNIIRFNYEENIEREILSDERARIYFITINEEIVKIGGSINRGGIRRTISFYENALTGSPGRPRFIIHLLIAETLTLNLNSKIEVYFTFLPSCDVKYKPFFSDSGEEDIQISEYKIFEEKCLEEFKKLLGKYPAWNFQENKESYPENLEKLYNIYQRKVRKK
ncbi:MAG: hypothetical protein ACO2O6_07155 [Candidatus Hydrothermia bacterium]